MAQPAVEKKAEKKVDANVENKDAAAIEQTADDVFIAEVTHVYNKVGAGGDINLVRVLLRHNNRSITRSVEGPVRVGDLLSLRECVRESRRSR
jgi:ribosomal protein S28E/S33